MGYAPKPTALTPSERAAIAGALSSRKGAVFRDQLLQAKFIDGILGAVGAYREESSAFDRGAVADRLKQLADEALRVSRSLDLLPPDVQDVFLDLVNLKSVGRLPNEFEPNARKYVLGIARAARSLRNDYARGRGEHDAVAGSARFLIWQIGKVWQDVFGKKPSATGSFAHVLEVILSTHNIRPVGRDALEAILAGK